MTALPDPIEMTDILEAWSVLSADALTPFFAHAMLHPRLVSEEALQRLLTVTRAQGLPDNHRPK